MTTGPDTFTPSAHRPAVTAAGVVGGADALVRTILDMPVDDDRGRTAQWRRLVDVVAEHGSRLSEAGAHAAFGALAALRPAVPVAQRVDAARAMAGRTRFAPLIAMFGRDEPRVAAEAMGGVRLDAAGWDAVLPSTTPLAREILRRRRDLPSAVVAQLRALGPGDAVLAPPTGAVDLPAADLTTALAPEADRSSRDDGQIRTIIDRIERYRASRSTERAPTEAVANGGDQRAPAGFDFEVGSDGIVDWADPAVRPALIGLTLAEVGEPGGPGTDASAVGAFRRRDDIANARLILGGTGPYAGEWRYQAIAWFDGDSGQFQGYRARARRPRADERAHAPVMASPSDGDGGEEALRELIHELRSPLNAITGFAQMIEGQMLGAVSQSYRRIAADIVADAAAIDRIIGDVALLTHGGEGARADQGPSADAGQSLASQVRHTLADLAALIGERRLSIDVDGLGAVAVRCDAAVVARMTDRLVSALLSVAAEGETIVIDTPHPEADDALVGLRVHRPATIADRDAGRLLDPGFSADGSAPTGDDLSLSFSLRLVASMAARQGGRLDLDDAAITLWLPSALGAAGDALSVNGPVPDAFVASSPKA